MKENENIKYPLADWKYEVASSETVLGYRDWIQHEIEAKQHGFTGIRLIALVDFPPEYSIHHAYAELYEKMFAYGLDGESSDEWYRVNGDLGDVEQLSDARLQFLTQREAT